MLPISGVMVQSLLSAFRVLRQPASLAMAVSSILPPQSIKLALARLAVPRLAILSPKSC